MKSKLFLVFLAALFTGKIYAQCPLYAFCDYSQGKVFIMENGELIWEHDAKDSNDLWVLPNGNLLFTTGKGVLEVTRRNDTIFCYTSASSIYGCQRLKNGNTFIAESNAGRLLEVARDGTIVKEVSILPPGISDAGYAFMRNARALDNGNYLVAHYKDQVVKEYNGKGEIVWSVAAPGGAHSVIRLPNGNTLIAITDAKLENGERNPRIIEVNKKGETVWELSNSDIPEAPLRFMTGMQYFSDGRLLLTNWVGHGKEQENIHLIYITKDKKIICMQGNHKGIKTMSSVYSLEKNKKVKSYH